MRGKSTTSRRGRQRMKWRAHRPPPYTPPGSITVDATSALPTIRVIAYGPDSFVDQPIDRPEQLAAWLHKYPVTWVNVDGLGDIGTIIALGEIFGLHRLALEDVVHLGQRPKVDEFDQTLYIVARMIDWSNGRLGTEQLNMFLGRDYVLTLQERPGDCLDAIRQRAKENRGKVREAGADYLAYCILDAIVDEYFPVLEGRGDRLEEIEDVLLRQPHPALARRVHEIRRDLLVLRRAMWPTREVMNILHRGLSPLVTNETRLHLRDCYDHTIQILDLIEVYRELATSVIEMHMTSVSNRMNEIMKLLTIIATIFIPLTFVVGIYGMNFDVMPELHWKWGYPAVWAVVAIIAVGMLGYFWKKGWLRSSHDAALEHDRRRDAEESQ
jgi:magnesium transporter